MEDHVKDVGTKDFENTVLRESWKRPVVVDFWASWCGPCRMLGPILEKLATEFDGTFLLAKLDTEAHPEIATRFDIRSIPNVKVFKEGKVVDELVGAVPEDKARAFLRRQVPSKADLKLAEAKARLQEGRMETARALLEEALKFESSHAGSLIELGGIMAAEGDSGGAVALWDTVAARSPLWEHAQALKHTLEFRAKCNAAGGPAACADMARRDPENLERRYSNGCCLAVNAEYRAALEEFLYVVKRDKNLQKEAARKAMLTVFSLIGERSALADEYRDLLAQALF